MQAFNFLRVKIADIFITFPIIANVALNSPCFNNEGIYRLEPSILLFDTYTFFSPKYPDLAKRFHQALVQLKESVTYQRIIDETK
ncbi:MAG: hypothetical protein ACI9ES_000648 [Oceanospirillaceae bacterium]|jgi:hypothetical protein